MTNKQPKPGKVLWTEYRVIWRFLTRVYASVPADPEMVDRWLKARQPRVKPAGARSVEEINEEVLASVERGEGEPDQTYSMLVFQRHSGNLVMRYGTVRAHIKECARTLSSLFIGKIEGERSFSVRVLAGVYPDPTEYWLPITREDGALIREADGAHDKAVHVWTPKGPIAALKRIEYVNPPSQLAFRLRVMTDTISEHDLELIFEYGGVHVYAGERGDGEGRYEFSIERPGVAENERTATTDSGGDHRETRTDPRRPRTTGDHREDRGTNGAATQGDRVDRTARTSVPVADRETRTQGDRSAHADRA